MSSLQIDHGTAHVALDAMHDVGRGSDSGVQPRYVTNDLLAATAAVLRAARDPRADEVQGLVEQPQ